MNRSSATPGKNVAADTGNAATKVPMTTRPPEMFVAQQSLVDHAPPRGQRMPPVVQARLGGVSLYSCDGHMFQMAGPRATRKEAPS